MSGKKIIILGGGISGLSAAYFFLNKNPSSEVILLEKNSRVGGWIHTERKGDFLFETGPHSFRIPEGHPFFELIEGLDLGRELLSAEKKLPRYLWDQGKLKALPTNPLSFLFSSLTTGMLLPLLRGKLNAQEESAYEFMKRAIGKEGTERLIEPCLLGIFAGDIKKLSAESCFPLLKEWERQGLSILKGFFTNKIPKYKVFSFKQGMGTLIQALEKRLKSSIQLSQTVQEITLGKKVYIKTQSGFFEGDHLVVALPVQEAAFLLEKVDLPAAHLLQGIQNETIVSVGLGFNKATLPPGFGYLIGSLQKEKILGALFDSNVFPDETKKKRVTVMMRGGDSEEDSIQLSFRALDHLSITEKPEAFSFQTATLPQFYVGHRERIEEFQKRMRLHPQISVIGNYLKSASLAICIQQAKEIVNA